MSERGDHSEYNPNEQDKDFPLEPQSLSQQGRFDRQRLAKNVITGVIGTIFLVTGATILYLDYQRGIEQSSLVPTSLTMAFTVLGGGLTLGSVIDIVRMLGKK
ncbi:hypothetical protein HYS94_05130 [Candidatus Daviesbacteria bacterium]|nr:hypothetical protein [Candidatus Daviesbacteria bacterium]